jgi:predicted DNA-binding transcriptional regulator
MKSRKRIKSIKRKSIKSIKRIKRKIKRKSRNIKRKSIKSRNRNDSGWFDYLFRRETPKETTKEMEKYIKVIQDIVNKIKNKLDKDKEKPSGNLNEEKLIKYLRNQETIDSTFRINHIIGAYGEAKETAEFKKLYGLIKTERSLFEKENEIF